MNILILATKYPLPEESQWLTSELGEELLKIGCNVTVLCIEWGTVNTNNHYHRDGLSIYRKNVFGSGSGALSLLFRWFFSSLKFAPFCLQAVVARKKYDLVLSFSPCLAMWFPILFAKFFSCYRHIIYWDFFPIHNAQISNKVPRFGLPVLKLFERFLLNSVDRVSCMSPANLKYFDGYFGRSSKERDIIPIWTSYLDYSHAGKKSVKKSDSFVTLVFGGQLVHGRGVSTLLEAVRDATLKNNKIRLIVCGSGCLAKDVLDFSRRYPNHFHYLGQISRDDYLSVLSSADIGVVATLEGVSCPTYPSKSLDYMACSLPIIASVEASSDFGSIIEEHGLGISCLAGDVKSLADNILKLAGDYDLRCKLGRRANTFLKEKHSVSKVAQQILEKVNVQK